MAAWVWPGGEGADALPMAVRTSGLVGRDRELANLAGALGAPPVVVLVEGEAGIGKSRLVAEFLRSPGAAGHKALMATCPAFRQPFTLGPVVDAIRQAGDDITGLGLSGLAGALRPLFPEWGDSLPPSPEPLGDPSAARHRLFRALSEFLGCLGVSVLVVEDVQWADEATVEFLLFMAAREPHRLSLIVTYRPEDVPEDSLLRRLSSRQSSSLPRLRVALSALNIADTARLISSMLNDEPVSDDFAALVYRSTEGLPLAVEESVRLLRDRRDLRRRGGEWVRRHLGDLDVPETLRDAVLERVARLDEAARAVLAAAAVLGEPASEQTLAAVASLPLAKVRAGRARALACGLVTEDGRGRAGFRHVLGARAVYEAIPVPERGELHLRAGHALQDVSPLPVAALARHFREAGQMADWRRYAQQAGDLALAVGDAKTVAVLVRELVAHADMAPGTVLLVARWAPFALLADYGQLADLIGYLRSALDGGLLAAAEQAEAGHVLGRMLMNGGELEAGVTELEQAIPGLEHRPVWAARSMLRLGWPSHVSWPVRVHRGWLDRAAVLLSEGSIPEPERAELTAYRAAALLALGEESGWAAAALAGQGRNGQERQSLAIGHLNVGDAAMLWGRYETARHHLGAALRLAEQQEVETLRRLILGTLAHLDWFTGAWDGLAERVAALAAQGGTEAGIVAGLLDAEAGASQQAERRLQATLEQQARHPESTAPMESAGTLARLYLRADRYNDALQVTEAPVEIIVRKGIWLWATEVVPVRVCALMRAGRCDEAAGLVASFERGMDGRHLPAPSAALGMCRAAVAQGQGDHGRAGVIFGQVAAAWQELPRPYDALLAREQQGRCLLAAGQNDAGLALLAGVWGELEALGVQAASARVAAVLRGHGQPRRRSGRRGYGNRLSPRETEVVRLVAAGRTNQEIASEVCRSLNTVQTQIRSAMRKFDVTSRAALAVRAAEAGLLAAEELPKNRPGRSPLIHSLSHQH